MFLLYSPPERTEYPFVKNKVPPKLDVNGELMIEKHPVVEGGIMKAARPLLHFPGLPDQASVIEEL